MFLAKYSLFKAQKSLRDINYVAEFSKKMSNVVNSHCSC